MATPTHLSIEALHELYPHLPSTAVVVDVRTLKEFSEGHVPKSINIPVDEVLNHAKDFAHYSTVYLYCKSGGRSSAAYDLLKSTGLKNLVCIDEGGFPDWAAHGFEVER